MEQRIISEAKPVEDPFGDYSGLWCRTDPDSPTERFKWFLVVEQKSTGKRTVVNPEKPGEGSNSTSYFELIEMVRFFPEGLRAKVRQEWSVCPSDGVLQNIKNMRMRHLTIMIPRTNFPQSYAQERDASKLEIASNIPTPNTQQYVATNSFGGLLKVGY